MHQTKPILSKSKPPKSKNVTESSLLKQSLKSRTASRLEGKPHLKRRTKSKKIRSPPNKDNSDSEQTQRLASPPPSADVVRLPSLHSEPLPCSPSVRDVIESTLRKSAGILSAFTENTICKTGSDFESLLSSEKFGFDSKKSREQMHSVQCSVSTTPRKKPDISKLPRHIAQLLQEDQSCASVLHKGAKLKKYHSNKMALKQSGGDETSSKVDLPVARIKSTSSSETKAPKIVVVSAPLNLEEKNSPPLGGPLNGNKERQSDKAQAQYKRVNHTNIIQSIKEAIEKVPHNSTMARDLEGKGGGGASSVVRKVTLGVEKGVAFVIGPKTKHPYYNTFGGVRDATWLSKTPSNRKWVINIGNLHDNEISFSLQDNTLMIKGFRQPSLKYPEGQTVSETITIPAGVDINNLRVYRSSNANELMVLEEIVPKAQEDDIPFRQYRGGEAEE